MIKRLKKFVAIATLMTSVMMVATPSPAYALTAEEIADQIADLQAQLVVLTAQLAELTGEEATVVISGCDISSFDRNLKLAMTGDDVKCLQIVLNSDSETQLADSGVGSSGEETSYFGPLTKAAVIKFQELYADEVLASWGLTTGTGFVGSTTRAKLNELLVAAEEEEEEPVGEPGDYDNEADCETANYYWYDDVCNAEAEEEEEVAAGLTVALSDVTPASTTIIADNATSGNEVGQLLVPFTTVDFTAGSEGSVTVTTLKFKRTGISADANFDSTYLYEGDTKLIEGGTISSRIVTFNAAAGIFTVPAGETKSITLKANLNYDVSAGKTMGFDLVSADDVTSDASEVNGTFPFAGNLMTLANATDLGFVTFTGYTSPPSGATVDAQDDYEVWRVTVTANEQDLDIERIVFTEIGSVLSDDLQNFNLYVGGTVIGTAEMDSNYEVAFDLSASPYTITKGTAKILKLHADIVKGASRNFRFTLQYPTDFLAKDANYGVYASTYQNGIWAVIQPDGEYTINAGDLSITKATDSPVSNIALNGTSVTLAKYDFKATGEDIKVSNLRIGSDYYTTSDLTAGLNNGKVYLDGVQVGSTKDIRERGTGATAPAYTIFTFGTSFIVTAGTTGVVEIKADVKDMTGTTGSLAVDKTITVNIEIGAANAQGQSSLTVLNRPLSVKPANTLTIKGGALTFTKSTAYGNQQTVRPATEFKVGSFSALAGSTEGVNIDSITVTFTTAEAAYMESLLLKVGADQIGSTKVTVAATNLFSVDTDLTKGGSKIIDVYADILSTASTLNADVTGTGTTVDTSASVDASSVTLQTVTVADGSLTVALASGTPDTAILTGMSADVELAKYTFSALFEAFTISEVKIKTLQNTDDDIVSLYLKYKDAAGDTVTSSALSLIAREADFVAMTFYVPANTDADLTVYGNTNVVAPAGYANTGDIPQLSLTYYKASSGSQSLLEGDYDDVVIQSSGGNATAVWSTDQAYVGNQSVRLIAPGTARAAARVSYGETLSTLVALTTTIGATETLDVIWNAYYPADSDGIAPYAVILLDTTGDDAVDALLVGGFDYVYESGGCSYSSWNKAMKPLAANFQIRDVDANNFLISGTYNGPYDDEVAGNVHLADLDASTDWAIDGDDPVVLYVGTSVTNNVGSSYADDIIIGGTTYSIEQIAGNEMLLYKTKPTVALTGTYSTTFSSGTNVLYPFTVAADGKGDVGLKTLIFNTTMATAAGAQVDTFKFYRGGGDITDEVTIVSIGLDNGDGDLEGTTYYFDPDDTATVTVEFATEEIITKDTSQTYYLKANATSIGTVGDSIQTYLKDDTAYNDPEDKPGDITGNFIWTDRSVPSAYHSEDESGVAGMADWLNGYLVDTLPSDIVTLSK